MGQQVTITVSEEVYQGLRTVAGSRTVGEFLEELARPGVAESQLEAAYREMMLDADRERDAAEWIDGLIGDSLTGDGDVAR